MAGRSKLARTFSISKTISDSTNDHAGDVVVLRGCADELVEAAHDAGEYEGGAFLRGDLDDGEQARFTEFVAVFVPGFGYAIGVNHQQIVSLQARDAGGVVFFQLDAERNVLGFQALDAAVFTFENRRIVAGANIAEIACCGVQLGEKSGCETAGLAIGADLSI